MAKKQRWLIIGPGIVLAAILALQVAIWNERNKATPAPPMIERQVIGGATRPSFEVKAILARAKELRLSGKQIAALEKLQGEWEIKSKPLIGEMNRAATTFRQFMKRADGKATIKEIQSHAAPVAELSRQVSSLRRIYWEKALQVLSDRQRKMLDADPASPPRKLSF